VWGAHYWAREIVKLGHQVKLMNPRYVRAYVNSNKTDARDAEAICEAVGRPSMRFVEVKSQAQREVMAHRVRAQLIRERISCRDLRDRFNFEGSLHSGVQFLRDAIYGLLSSGPHASPFRLVRAGSIPSFQNLISFFALSPGCKLTSKARLCQAFSLDSRYFPFCKGFEIGLQVALHSLRHQASA
jgi:hypothetical protein